MSLATILWVDDEIESLQSQKLFLENKGYNVHTLTNGFDAVNYVKEHPVDVVMAHQDLPLLPGVGLLALVREEFPAVRRVLVTREADAEQAPTTSVAHSVLREPWDRSHLATAVAIPSAGVSAGRNR